MMSIEADMLVFTDKEGNVLRLNTKTGVVEMTVGITAVALSIKAWMRAQQLTPSVEVH